jgi:uncharacterized membrane protein
VNLMTRTRFPAAAGALSAGVLLLAFAGGGGCQLLALSPNDPLDPDLVASLSDTDCGEVDATYENFAADFFARYCLRCHSETLVGDSARQDAPVGIDFDTRAGAESFASRIRLRAGLDGDMPPRILGGARPTHSERVRLIQWIDCGME